MANDDLERVIAMRRDNADVFELGEPADNVLFVIEEMNEFWKVWQKTLGKRYLRNNPVRDIDTHLKMQFEWGQAFMMLLTCAMQAQVNPDLALHSAVEEIYDRCVRERRKLESKDGEDH